MGAIPEGVHVFYIKGNHEPKNIKNYKNNKIVWMGDKKDIKIHDQKVTLTHFPMSSWECSHYGAWHLFGHYHNLEKTQFLYRMSPGKKLNVNWQFNDFKFWEWEQVKIFMATQKNNWDLLYK